MKKPNFFIVGAPKCGTSSVAHMLRAHPQAFILLFEPNFFCTDIYENREAQPDIDWYLGLYDRPQTQGARAIGDKSVAYFYSTCAIRNILEFDPAARLIVCLRNPVDMVYSWHAEMLMALAEDEENFERAWALQDERLRGERLPPLNLNRLGLQYREMGRLGTQLQIISAQVPPEQLQIIFLDDLIADRERVYRELLGFLDLPYVAYHGPEKLQAHRTYRSRAFAELLHPRSTGNAARLVQGLLALTGERQTGLRNRLLRLNRKDGKRKPLDAGFRRELQAHFKPEVELLAELTGRNLDHWLASDG